MAKIRPITKRHLSDVKFDIQSMDVIVEDGKQYEMAENLLKDKNVLYCCYWGDKSLSSGNGMYDYTITREDCIEKKKYLKNEITIEGTNKDVLGMCGTKYDVGVIRKIIYNSEYRYVKVYYYNKYRKKDDMDYISCWGVYDIVGGKMSERMKKINDENFNHSIDRIKEVMAR